MSTLTAYASLLLAALILLVGYFSLRQILYCVRFGTASKHWPDVEGVVVHSALASEPLPEHQDESKQTIEYEYCVDGKHYLSDRISFNHAILPSIFQSKQERMFKNYAVGTPLRVFYDPDDPMNTTLITGFHLLGVTSNFVTGVLSIFGGTILLILGVDAFQS